MAIAGITFDNATVTSKNDGGLFRAFGDRLITSKYIIASDKITITQGYLVIAGRNIHITADEVINVNPTVTNGYGRIKIAVDLTKTAGSQVYLVEQYSATMNGFSALTQNDINENKNYYEAVVCYFSVTAGAISKTILTESKSMHSVYHDNGIMSVSADFCFNEGVYLVSDVTTGLPIGVAGYLEVLNPSGEQYMQIFTTSSTHVSYFRIFDGTQWKEWSAEQITADRLPVHTHSFGQISGGTLILNSNNYGETLPASGVEGQIFFKII